MSNYKLCINCCRGSVPPGARFDPIHPGHPGRRGGPDPDHLPMPGGGGFNDHMFM